MTASTALTLGISLLCLSLCGCERSGAQGPRPNIVLITLDTVRADHLSCYGYGKSATPAIDRIAREGVRFDSAISSSPWTLPAHASLLTGLAVSQHGARYDVRGSEGINLHRIKSLGPGPTTLAEALRRADYYTMAAVAGVWMKPDFGADRGFDRYEAKIESWAGVPAEELTESAVELIDRRSADRPFLLFLNYFDAHLPYAPPAEFNPAGTRLDRSGSEIELHVNRHGQEVDPTERDQLTALYDAEIRRIDHHLGKLWAALEERDLYDRTWIIVTADHGESFGEHRFFGHGLKVWHDVARVPLIMKPPAGALRSGSGGAVVHETVQPRECFATILRALDLPLPPHVTGRNLLSTELGDETIVIEAFRSYSAIKKFGPSFDRDERALYKGGLKLLRRSDGALSLYDIAADPGELDDLALAQSERAQEMVDALDTWTLRAGRPVFSGKAATIDSEDERRLRALGYLD